MTENSLKRLKWQVPEYRVPERPRSWYTVALILLTIAIFFSFFAIRNWHLVFLGAESNFLFAIILALAVTITILNENRPPIIVNIILDPEGIKVGSKFYDYDEFKHFSVIYKPKQSLKSLYLEFKSGLRPRLSIPLRSLDALTIRNYLIKYLDEDLERTDAPLSEQLTKLLKL